MRCYNLSDIKLKLEKELARDTVLIESWKKITFPVKKDGSPFAVMSKNFTDCRIETRKACYDTDKNVYDITVYAYSRETGHIYDETSFLGSVENAKGNITDRIDYYTRQIHSLKKQIENAETVYKEFRNAYVKIVQDLKAAAGDNTDLYYEVKETVQERYPYC